LGSGGVCATNALQYYYDANFARVDDFQHGVNCDTRVMGKWVGRWSFILLVVVGFNCTWGPDREEARYKQILDTMGDVYEKVPANSNVLYKNASLRIADELDRKGVELPGERPKEVEVYDYLKKELPARRYGHRLNLGRFGDSVEGCMIHLGNWFRDEFESSTVALEWDMLKGKKLEKLIVHAAAAEGEVPESGSSTSSLRATIDEKMLRSSADNALIIKTLMWSVPMHRQIMYAFLRSSKPSNDWRKAANHFHRDPKETKPWLTSQIAEHHVMHHINDTVKVLEDGSALQEIGFLLSPEAMAHASNSEAYNRLVQHREGY